MALKGFDTGGSDSLRPELLADAALTRLRDRIVVEFDPDLPDTASVVTLKTTDGKEHVSVNDVGQPVTDRLEQGERLQAKFRLLVEPILGRDRTEQLIDDVMGIERLPSVDPITSLLRPLSIPEASNPRRRGPRGIRTGARPLG